MAYKNVTFSLEESIAKDLKRLALDEETSQKKLVNEMLKEGIRQKRGQSKLDGIS